MREHHIAVRRTARYYTLGEPGAPELWFVLHGYSQLARRFLRRFEPIAAPERCIVAPEALNRYYSEYAPGYHVPNARIGATWMTKEDREAEIEDYVAYLDDLYRETVALWPAPPARTVLLGFSQGVATAARWAALGNARFGEILSWSGYLPPELELRPDLFHGADLTFLCGRNDGYTPREKVDAHSATLEQAGLAHRVVWFHGEHEIAPDALREVAGRTG